MDEDKKVGEGEQTPPQPSPEEIKEQEELTKKNEQLANVQKAIDDANAELRKVRSQKKQIVAETKPEEQELKIDLEDPSAKAWDKHIRQQITPVETELEQEKEEIRSYALREFLADKPSLASKPEKLKELIQEYEALSVGRISGKTKEGVLLYLNKAYASVFHD